MKNGIYSLLAPTRSDLSHVTPQGQLIAILLPDDTTRTLKSKLVASWLFGAGLAERDAKMAASFKVGKLISNALHLHHVGHDIKKLDEVKDSSSGRTSAVVALSHYTDLSRQKEVVGGFLWVIRQYWTSALASKEGIFFGARLIASNLAQWAVLAVCLSLVVIAAFRMCNDAPKNAPYLQPSRSIYFNDSGSFLLFEDEISASFLQRNNLVFGYVFDDLNSTYVEVSKQAIARSFLSKMMSFPVITSFYLEDSSDENVADRVFDSFSNLTGLNITMAFADPSSFQLSFSGNFVSVLSDQLRQRAGNLE